MANKLQKGMQDFGIKQALKYLEKDPEENIPKLMEMVDRFAPQGWYEGQRNMIRKVIQEKGNWYELILRLYELDPGVRKAFFQNFIFNASLNGSALQDQLSQENNCNIPWAILLDPTSACNLHCTGCWAAEYGHQLNLSLETIDSIVKQGKKLGTYMYIYTGGEPLVRKQDLIKICEMNPDCEFLSFTNGTLIDEEFCQEMLRVKNFVPAISLEGFEDANDGRRGDGVFQKVQHAMALLKSHKLPFGISTCYTSRNFEDISSEAFYDMMIESGAFLDLIARYGYLKNDIDSGNMSLETGSSAFSLTAEMGHTFRFMEERAYIEPQVEFTYGFVSGDDDTASNGVKIEQDDFQSFVTRIGVRTGFDFPKKAGTIYGMVSYSYDFLGDADGMASEGNLRQALSEDLGGGWVSYGIGAQVMFGKSSYFYGELERTSGGEVDNPYLFNAGVRITF